MATKWYSTFPEVPELESRHLMQFNVILRRLIEGVDVCPLQRWGCPRVVMVKAMDCRIVVREFVLQSCYYVHFRANTLGKGMNPIILPAMG